MNEAAARELDMPIYPTGSSALSVGQYCIDMLMIMNVTIGLCLRPHRYHPTVIIVRVIVIVRSSSRSTPP